MYLSGGHGSTHNHALLFAIHFHIHGLIASSPEPGHWVSGLLASMTIAEPRPRTSISVFFSPCAITLWALFTVPRLSSCSSWT